MIGSFDDFDVDLVVHPSESIAELRPLIAAVCIQFAKERIGPKQRGHDQHASVAVLDIGRVDHGMEQQTLCVYKDMTLLSFDLLAAIVTMRVDRTPPFSALFTLWLSMMQAVGLGSRVTASRQDT